MLYVILTDIHANHTALQAIEQEVQALYYGDTLQYWFLGDLLGYGPASQAIGCIHWLRFESQICSNDCDNCHQRWVLGNHDEWIVRKLGRVRDEGAVTLLAQRMELESRQAEDWGWFERCVTRMLQADQTLLVEGHGSGETTMRLAFTHAGVNSLERRVTYLRPWEHSTLQAHFSLLQQEGDTQTLCLFCGHTHLPLLAQIQNDQVVLQSIKYGQPITLTGGHFVVNPGSVGHPRDGDPRASFVVFDPQSRELEFHRVRYNTRQVVSELRVQKNNHSVARKEAALYLIAQDIPRLKEEGGLDINPQKPPKRLLQQYLDKVDQAYERLIHELESGDGGEEMQRYRQVYHVPEWDLEAVHKA